MPDLDDLLPAIFEALGLRNLPASERAKGCARVGFGALLVGLSAAGAWQMRGYPASLHFRVAGVAVFVGLAAFGLFNVVLRRPWRWPGCLFLLAFAGLFAGRILLGP
jgi:hypothetical protein